MHYFLIEVAKLIKRVGLTIFFDRKNIASRFIFDLYPLVAGRGLNCCGYFVDKTSDFLCLRVCGSLFGELMLF